MEKTVDEFIAKDKFRICRSLLIMRRNLQQMSLGDIFFGQQDVEKVEYRVKFE